jgi:hypothetical protein
MLAAMDLLGELRRGRTRRCLSTWTTLIPALFIASIGG